MYEGRFLCFRYAIVMETTAIVVKTAHAKLPRISEKMKSLAPERLCVRVNTTASVLSSGNVSARTGTSLMQKISNASARVKKMWGR